MLICNLFYFVSITGRPADSEEEPELPEEPAVYGCQTLSEFRAEAALDRMAATMVPVPPPAQPQEEATFEVAICAEPPVPNQADHDDSSSSDSGQFRFCLNL